MNGQQFIQFGFSRNLNVNELLNLSKDAVKNDNDKYDYTINYKKYGDINARDDKIRISSMSHHNYLSDHDVSFDSNAKQIADAIVDVIEKDNIEFYG